MMSSITRRVVLAGALAAGMAAAVPVSAADKIKVAAVYTVPIEQQWVSRIHKALKASEGKGDIEYTWTENTPTTDTERVTREYATKGYQLIVGEAFSNERAFRKVANDFLKTAFLFGSSFGPSGKNFSVFDNYIQEPAYLTGLIAGSMTKSNVIGMVGGYPIPEVNRLMHAFMDGAKETNPNVKFLVTFIGSWFDPPKAKEAAFAQIDRGADLLYAERFGVSDAAKEKGKLAIGNVIDTQSQYPETVVASALWMMEPTISLAIEKVKGGTFTAEDYGQYSLMKFGGSALAPYGTFESKIPAAAKELVTKRQQEMSEGLYRVNVNDSEPKSTM